MAPKLSKPVIVQTALELLDEVGLDGLTVRALAARLGVQAPALYWHVRDKQHLLDEMATELWRRILDELDAIPDDAPWPAGFLAFANATRRILLQHRDGAKVFSGTYLTDPELLRRQEEPMGRMIAQGFRLEDVVRAYSLVYNFTIGFCIEEQWVAQNRDSHSLEERAERIGSDSPLAVDAGPVIFGDPDARFADLVGVLLDAVGRMRASG